MSTQDRDQDRPERTERGSVSRRGFIGLAGVAAAGAGSYLGREATPADPAVADATLTDADLVGRESYVEWRIDPERAPLPAYLADAVPSFAGGGTATGYVSDGTTGLPKYVESAVFTADDWDAITDATAEWFADSHADPPTVTRREPDRVAWHGTTEGGLLDAVRVDRVDDAVAITIVGGRSTGLGPRDAARRYGNAVRDRIR